MNTRRLAVLLVVLLAFVSGYYLGRRLTLLKEAKKAFRDVGNTQRFATTISVAALERLENGDIDGTKYLLATNFRITTARVSKMTHSRSNPSFER